jgi:succinate dehydrogenase / fumarate reductase cytochrome b subunit
MMFSGLMVLAFVIMHLLHLTVRTLGPSVDPLYDAAGRIDVYALVVTGFSDPLTAALYLVAMLFLGLHLAHAMQSLVQTLGFNHEVYQPLIRLLAAMLTALIVLGFASIPVMVQLNVLNAGGG